MLRSLKVNVVIGFPSYWENQITLVPKLKLSSLPSINFRKDKIYDYSKLEVKKSKKIYKKTGMNSTDE